METNEYVRAVLARSAAESRSNIQYPAHVWPLFCINRYWGRVASLFLTLLVIAFRHFQLESMDYCLKTEAFPISRWPSEKFEKLKRIEAAEIDQKATKSWLDDANFSGESAAFGFFSVALKAV